jgi:hypothetical protein
MLSEQSKPDMHGIPTAGWLGGVAGAGGMGEHDPNWQLPPGQSVSVEQDGEEFDESDESSENEVEDDCCAGVTQPASNPRSSAMVRFMP